MRIVGEILVLILLLLANGRVLFLKHEKKDALVVLSPLSLLLIILQIIAWGIDFFNAYILLLSILILFSNFHALFRYTESLYVDHYSTLMKFWAFFTILFTVLGIIVLVLFFPKNLSNKELEIVENKKYYEGCVRTGFIEKTVFGKTNVILSQFEKEAEEIPEESKGIVLLLPDKRADTEYYRPYLQLLASKGYTVYSADFYTEDIKWFTNYGEYRFSRQFIFILNQLFNKDYFISQKNMIDFNVTSELESIFAILENDFQLNKPVFLVTDKMTAPAGKLYKMKNPDKISDILDLSSLQAYKTPGFGFITYNNPLLAKILGFEKTKNTAEIDDTVTFTLNLLQKNSN